MISCFYYGSCIQCDTFWSSVRETFSVAQDQDVFPRGQPVPHGQGYEQVCFLCGRNLGSCPRVTCWELLVIGIMLTTDASLTGWGATTSDHSTQGLLLWGPENDCCLSSFETLPPRPEGHHVLVHTDKSAVS